jgi:1,5-anhydro-D-fructose reductase (1,5-anhydro-D-mannitol-forming)
MAGAESLIAIAIVGCAHIHTPQFAQIITHRQDYQVKAVWDSDAARAQKWAKDFKSTATADLASIWNDKEIKAVVICSETVRHEDLVIPGAKAGKHLFVEKPLGMGARDSYAMAEAIDKAGVIFQTGYFQRGTQVNLFLKECVTSGTFGKITRVRHSNCHQGALEGWFDKEYRWMADPKQAGVGGFGDLGAHSVDLLVWLMGDVERCTAVLSEGTKRYTPADETGEGLLCFKSGTIGTIAAGWDDVANPVSLVISGTEGHASVVNDRLFITSKNLPGADGQKPWKQLPKPLSSPFELFLDSVAGAKGLPLVKAREAAYECAVMEAMMQANSQSKWVEVQGSAH